MRLFIALLTLIPILVSAGSSAVQVGDPYALLEAINQLRATNGLPPYQMNSALMIIAQNQSNYQASLGTWSHTGPGGSDETQRAIAAGYGAGDRIMCDENVAFGLNLSAQGCVEIWMDSAAHLSNMLSTRYVDAGAGATADATGRVFYTLDVCYTIGNGASQPLQAGATATALPTLEPFFGVETVTPAPDGEVVHEVMPGQSLYAIAEAYGITLDVLLELNKLTRESVIQPGDKLIIRAASSATLTLEATRSPTQPPPTSTRLPTRTPTLRPSASPTSAETPLPSGTPEQASVSTGDRIGDALLAAVLFLAVVGAVLVITGFVLKRRN